jgi:hypothetical protein
MTRYSKCAFRHSYARFGHVRLLDFHLLMLHSYLAYSSTLNMESILPPKRRGLNEIHDVTTQKTVFFIGDKPLTQLCGVFKNSLHVSSF